MENSKNYLIILDYNNGKTVIIKLSEEQKKILSVEDDFRKEAFVGICEKYGIDYTGSECMVVDKLNVDLYGMSKHDKSFTSSIKDDVDDIRVCSHCGAPMYEGYVVGNEYACSEECAIALYGGDENKFKEDLKKASDINGETYWTEWESIYQDDDTSSGYDFKIGDEVLWKDPAGETGGTYTIYSINGFLAQHEVDGFGESIDDETIICCANEYGEVEAFPTELLLLKRINNGQ